MYAIRSYYAASLANGLREAMDTLQSLRLKAQMECLREGKEPDNLLPLEPLADDDHRRLKHAFHTVQDLQSFLSDAYGVHLIT